MTTQPANSLLDSLVRANKFCLSDLEMNRQGWMSPQQKSRRLWDAIFSLLLALAMIVVLIVALVSWGLNLKGGAVIGIIALIAGVCVLLYKGVMTFADASSGRAAVVEGAVSSTARYGSSHSSGSSYYVVNGRKYSGVSSAGREVINNNPCNYRLYYMPRTRRMLSIEPL